MFSTSHSSCCTSCFLCSPSSGIYVLFILSLLSATFKIQSKCSTSFLCCILQESTSHHFTFFISQRPLPCFQPAFVRRTSGRRLGTFRAVNILFCSVINVVPLTTSRLHSFFFNFFLLSVSFTFKEFWPAFYMFLSLQSKTADFIPYTGNTQKNGAVSIAYCTV